MVRSPWGSVIDLHLPTACDKYHTLLVLFSMVSKLKKCAEAGMVRAHACYCTCQVHLYATNVRLATREPCSRLKYWRALDHSTARSLDRENIDILPSIPLYFNKSVTWHIQSRMDRASRACSIKSISVGNSTGRLSISKLKPSPWIRKIPLGTWHIPLWEKENHRLKSAFGMEYVSALEGKMSPNWPFQKENCLEFHHQKKQKTLRWWVGFNKMKSLPDMQPKYSMRLVYLPFKRGRLEWTCKYTSPIWVSGIWLSKFTEMPRMYVIFPYMFLFWMEKCRSIFLS